MKKEERFFERIVLLLLLAGAAFLYYNASLAKSVATGTDMASMDFPKGILLVLMVLCIGKLIGGMIVKGTGAAGPDAAGAEMADTESADAGSIAKADPAFTADKARPRDSRTILTMAAIVIYAFFWRILGFCLSSFLFFFAESILLRPSAGKRQAALISVCVTLAVYVIFGMAFGVDFPEPLLELITG